jgi:hypothetical protein
MPLKNMILASVKHLYLQYTSSSNTLISITIMPLGGSPTTYGPTACTTASCTISFSTTPGPTTLVFTLTDGSSNVLSTFSNQRIIQPSTLNTLNFTANSVVHAFTLQPASANTNAGRRVALCFKRRHTQLNTLPAVVSSANFLLQLLLLLCLRPVLVPMRR